MDCFKNYIYTKKGKTNYEQLTTPDLIKYKACIFSTHNLELLNKFVITLLKRDVNQYEQNFSKETMYTLLPDTFTNSSAEVIYKYGHLRKYDKDTRAANFLQVADKLEYICKQIYKNRDYMKILTEHKHNNPIYQLMKDGVEYIQCHCFCNVTDRLTIGTHVDARLGTTLNRDVLFTIFGIGPYIKREDVA